MTEQQSCETLLAFLRVLDHQYTAPSVLTTDDYPGPMLYPVVTAYDFDADLQVFIACVVNPDESLRATEWANEVADQVMAQWAPPGEEPMECDVMVWIGMEPSALRGVQA